MALCRSSGPPQKFSTIQALHSVVGAGIATNFPSCEGIAQVAWKFFTCQSGVAFPAKSTNSTVSRRRRVAGDKKSFAVRCPVKGHEIVPVLYGDLTRGLACERDQSNLMLGGAYVHCGNKSSIR